MTTAADDLAVMAESASLGTMGISIFADVEPADSDPNAPIDPAVTLYNYPSEGGVYTMEGERSVIERPRVQVKARSRVYADAAALAEQLYKLFSVHNVAVGGAFYTMVRPMQRPTPMGPDDLNRQQIGFNVATRRHG